MKIAYFILLFNSFRNYFARSSDSDSDSEAEPKIEPENLKKCYLTTKTDELRNAPIESFIIENDGKYVFNNNKELHFTNDLNKASTFSVEALKDNKNLILLEGSKNLVVDSPHNRKQAVILYSKHSGINQQALIKRQSDNFFEISMQGYCFEHKSDNKIYRKKCSGSAGQKFKFLTLSESCLDDLEKEKKTKKIVSKKLIEKIIDEKLLESKKIKEKFNEIVSNITKSNQNSSNSTFNDDQNNNNGQNHSSCEDFNLKNGKIASNKIYGFNGTKNCNSDNMIKGSDLCCDDNKMTNNNRKLVKVIANPPVAANLPQTTC